MPRAYAKVSDEVRFLVIQAYQEGIRVVDIAKLYQVKLKNCYQIVSRIDNFERGRLQRGHRQQKIQAHHREKIHEWLDENCQLTLQDLCGRLSETFNV